MAVSKSLKVLLSVVTNNITPFGVSHFRTLPINSKTLPTFLTTPKGAGGAKEEEGLLFVGLLYGTTLHPFVVQTGKEGTFSFPTISTFV